MPQTCTICRSPNKDEIDRALVADEPYRGIAGRYGCSPSAVLRHKSSCLPETLQKAREASETARGDDLLQQLKALQTKARIVWESAAKAGDRKGQLGAIREERDVIGMIGKLTGQFDGRPPQEHEHWHLHAAVYAEPLEIRKVFVSNDRWPTVEERKLLLDETPNGDKKH